MLTGKEPEELSEISCDRTLKFSFMQQQLSKFWFIVVSKYPLLSRKAVEILLLFATTYLCKAGFWPNQSEKQIQIQTCSRK